MADEIYYLLKLSLYEKQGESELIANMQLGRLAPGYIEISNTFIWIL